MKKTLIILGIVSLLGCVSRCGAADDSLYRAGEVSFDLFGTVRTPDFNAESLGYGVGMNYFLTRQIGIGVESRWERIDAKPDVGLSGIYRFPIGGTGTAPYVFGGGDFDIRREAFGIHVGTGLEHRFTKGFGIFGDARLQKYMTGTDAPSEALARLGVRLNF